MFTQTLVSTERLDLTKLEWEVNWYRYYEWSNHSWRKLSTWLIYFLEAGHKTKSS